jgi:hypothetical protein
MTVRMLLRDGRAPLKALTKAGCTGERVGGAGAGTEGGGPRRGEEASESVPECASAKADNGDEPVGVRGEVCPLERPELLAASLPESVRPEEACGVTDRSEPEGVTGCEEEPGEGGTADTLGGGASPEILLRCPPKNDCP